MKAIKYTILGLVFGTTSIEISIAQNVEQIYMKSGSVVEGYIAEQKPGKYITIQTNWNSQHWSSITATTLMFMYWKRDQL